MARIPRICPCGYRVAADHQCACQKARKAAADKERPSARKRGYDTAWQKAAAAFLKEPGNQRCACGAPATVVMHRISIRQRPDLKMVRGNWQPGCVRCNAIQADRERRETIPDGNTFQTPGGGRRLSAVATGPDGAPDSAKIFNRAVKFEVLP
jgi:hypothetical protein